jgi:phenylalanyl-tRNA synthetase beta subunit
LINSNVTAEEAVPLLLKKQILATVIKPSVLNTSPGVIRCVVPAHRADVLHWSDVAEDLLIALGIDKIKLINPTFSVTGASLLAEDATELVRQVGANNGYVEMYNFVLISVEDGYQRMYRATCAGHCGSVNKMSISSSHSPYGSLPTASSTVRSDSFCQCGIVRTLNGKLIETEAVRLSLLPGLFKSLKNNNAHPKPLSVFEVGDVVIPDYFGCGFSFIPQTGTEKRKKCERVCGGGCCASSVDLNTLYSASLTVPLAPNPRLPPLFEYPNVLGVLRSDSGCRNERHFAAVKCGPDVSPEQLIPLLARLLSNFHLTFNSSGEDGLKRSYSDSKSAGNVINNVEGYWELLHIPNPKNTSSVVNKPAEGTSSYIRWASDSSSFIQNNFCLICLTYFSVSSNTSPPPSSSLYSSESSSPSAFSSSSSSSSSSAPILFRHPVGIMGCIRPDVVKSFNINSNVIAFEINLEPLYDRLLYCCSSLLSFTRLPLPLPLLLSLPFPMECCF